MAKSIESSQKRLVHFESEINHNDLSTSPFDIKKREECKKTALKVFSDSNGIITKSSSPKFGKKTSEIRLKKRVLYDVFHYEVVLPHDRRRCLG